MPCEGQLLTIGQVVYVAHVQSHKLTSIEWQRPEVMHVQTHLQLYAVRHADRSIALQVIGP